MQDPDIAELLFNPSFTHSSANLIGITEQKGLRDLFLANHHRRTKDLRMLSFWENDHCLLCATGALFDSILDPAHDGVRRAEKRLEVGDVAYGFLRAAPGIGAAAMAIFLATAPITRRVGRTLLIAIGVFGVATVALGLTRSYAVAFAALVVLAGADMISVYIRGSLVPLVTPDEKRGRVMAVENVFIGGSNEIGALESGLVAQAFGTSATVVGGGLATIGIVALWSIAFPQLRDVDRFDDLAH